MIHTRPAARSSTLVGVIAVLAMVLSASVGIGARPAIAATTTIRFTNDGVAPRQVSIVEGSSVTWRNDSAERHRIRSTTGPIELDSGNLEPGQTWTVTLTQAGTYRYVDHRNEGDTRWWGEIVVSDDTRPPGSADDPGPSPESAEPSAPATAEVDMLDRSFAPGTVEIRSGGTVTWTNRSDRDHTATADSGTFASPVLSRGGSFGTTFPAAGTYAYFCELHPDMRATVIVEGGGPVPEAPEPTTPPPSPAAPGRSSPSPAPTLPPTADDESAPRTLTVEMVDFAFRPARLEAHVGDSVRFRNAGAAPHTATAGTGLFDTGLLRRAQEATIRLDRIGTISYVCELHPEMVAAIVVSARPSGSALPATVASGRADAEIDDRSTLTASEPRRATIAGSQDDRDTLALRDVEAEPTSSRGTALGIVAAGAILAGAAALLATGRRFWEAAGRAG